MGAYENGESKTIYSLFQRTSICKCCGVYNNLRISGSVFDASGVYRN